MLKMYERNYERKGEENKMIEVGRVCVKLSGREAGKICVVTKKIDKTFVEVTGPRNLTGVKRRRCNIMHLEPTKYLLKIKEGASDEEIIKVMKKENLIKKFNLKFKKIEKKEMVKKEKAKKSEKKKKKSEK